jgi:mannose-6-phosphate isomerase-like protein (cupin superfamily)
MEAFRADLKALTKDNDDFRRVVFTGEHAQLVLMALRAAEDIGEEVHAVDQILYAVSGQGESILDGRIKSFEKGDVVAVPAGTRHNIRNTGEDPLKLFTAYAPPQHTAGTIHKTKADAMRDEADIPAAR